MCWSRKGKAYWERLIVLNFFIVEALRYVAKMTLRICHFNHYFIDIGISEDYERFMNSRF